MCMKATEEQDRYVYIAGWIVLVLCASLLVISKWMGINFIKILPPCLFHAATGYYCPGCGGSRAVLMLLSGHLIKSALYHPFFFYGVCVGGWFMLSQSIQRVSKGKIAIGMHYKDRYLWIAILLIAMNWIIKNEVLFFWSVDLLKLIG